MNYDEENSAGWDCDPNAIIALDIDDRDEEEAESDWQEVALDRWGDRHIRY